MGYIALVRRHNFRPHEVLAMTPGAISATLHFCEKDRRLELADLLNVSALAARGELKEIERTTFQLSR